MARCNRCENEYDQTIEIRKEGQTYYFDCFECAIDLLAPRCWSCGVPILGHGLEDINHTYCSAHCARKAGKSEFQDRSEQARSA